MDSPDSVPSDSADAYVALIQKQIRHLSEQVMEGQIVEAVVPLPSGVQIVANSFGAHNPGVIKINGCDANGNEVCLLAHKSTLQVLLRTAGANAANKPQVNFQTPESDQSGDLTFNETA